MKVTTKVVPLATALIMYGSFIGGVEAAIHIDITGTSGAGTTTWAFSGSTTVLASGRADTFYGPVGGDVFASGVYNSIFPTISTVEWSGSAIGTHPDEPDHLWLNNAAGNEEWWWISGSPGIFENAFNTVAGEIAMSGQWIMPIDINTLNIGNYTGLTIKNGFNQNIGGEVNISVSVPEPSSVRLLGLGALGFATRRKRTT